MNRQWKQVLTALILGAFLPAVMLNAGRRGQAVQQPEPTQQIQTQPTQPQQTAVQIRVALSDEEVCEMELEEYICGVVLLEMPASFELEALKAQAVAARTYALRRMVLLDRHTDYGVCADSMCCQAYISEAAYLDGLGTKEDVMKVRQAVQVTAGQVLTYDGDLAEATYFSCSGGRTEDAYAVWGEQIPYLQAVDSPGEEEAENYASSLHFTKQAFCAALGRDLLGNPGSWLGEVSYTEGGGVEMMFLGGVCYSGVELRKLLELNSTAFTMTAENGGITVTTRGKGHRVGMSQYGAEAMAVAGSDYLQILAHYYPSTVIDKWAVIG